MQIQSMFKDDINRKINGVVKVDQSEDSIIAQEVSEYVITNDLKKHFLDFFKSYNESFDQPTDDIGVWITGFFGSGKSHFLKMLSYLLENREIDGLKTVDRFREKFDDPGAFFDIDRAVKNEAATVLFNIDIEGSKKKDNTAVLRVFAKMFYNHLGYYGEDLKVAKLERLINRNGKLEEFCRVFERVNGQPWADVRDTYSLFEEDVVKSLVDAGIAKEKGALNWIRDSEDVDFSIAKLVSEIKEYVDSKPDSYRLLFMVDEVGQYVGEDTSLLLNLQSLIEKIGSECHGKVWIVCTGQEAIDDIIKARENEFSRIQARFKTRISLTSSSADEVIQKRILQKTPAAETELKRVYNDNDSVLRNIFAFTDAVKDIKGFAGEDEFVRDFPFVPYQFILLREVFQEIRRHGNAGIHFSKGERSMLSGFQEAAQKIQTKDEYALAPFHLFYKTVHSFLDSTIREVVERCQRAAEAGDGIEPQDVDVLKLLYLIRYIDDVKANINNIVVLMADDIRLDKVAMEQKVRDSLARLMSENYVACADEVYNFLTDEEQDIQRDINTTQVSSADVIGNISKIIFDDIYKTKNFSVGRNSFPFGKKVDEQDYGMQNDDLTLKFLALAADKSELEFAADSVCKVLVVLKDTRYYETLENAKKIEKYVKQLNEHQLPDSKQKIITFQKDLKQKYFDKAKELLEKAIEEGDFYIDGESRQIPRTDAKTMLSAALNYLVTLVYKKLDMLNMPVESDKDIVKCLSGKTGFLAEDMDDNAEGIAEIESYLERQARLKVTASMSDLVNYFQKKPYGWREIDIAAAVATLIYGQKVTVKYGGKVISPDDPKLPEYLRKKTEIANTVIAQRQAASSEKVRKVREFLRGYFDAYDVPEDELGLTAYIVQKFEEQRTRCETMLRRYEGHKYPDRDKVEGAAALMNNILAQKKDSIALIQHILDQEESLNAARDDLQVVEDFLSSNKVALFNSAAKLIDDISLDWDFIAKDQGASEALSEICSIITIPPAAGFRYDRIPELNTLIKKVKSPYDAMLQAKRETLHEIVRWCRDEIQEKKGRIPNAAAVCEKANDDIKHIEDQIDSVSTLTLLDGLERKIWKCRDDALLQIDDLRFFKDKTAKGEVVGSSASKGTIKNVSLKSVFSAKIFRSEAEIDAYVEEIRAKMKAFLKGNYGIKLS